MEGIRNMMNQFSRTQLLFGPEAMERLRKSRVAVFGLGGVGGYAVEALARSGIGALDLIDHDRICLTNLNRQLLATRKTIGQYKADAAEERVHEINPDCRVRTYKTFFLPDTRDQFDFSHYDYVIDAIDTVTGKLALIEAAQAAGTPIICSMGAGNKTDPTAFRVADIYQTSVCPLARVIRSECRKRGIRNLKVVYSTEQPVRPQEHTAAGCLGRSICPPDPGEHTVRRDIPGSTAFVPSVAGLIIAGEVIKDIAEIPR
uniref:ThiF family protein n=1 Tax=uncultured bacterium Contigcl_23 TaxID=1393667 RepID=W0FL03_9BACT|nr:ThiF family protein [uncultured bacterium Contigcl_23]